MPERLTHLDPLGRARMVDVTPKDPSHRRAVARGRVHMQPETTALVARGAVGKGDVLNVARVGQVHLFYTARLLADHFDPGHETMEARLFTEAEVPWDEIAFRTVKETLEHYFADRRKGTLAIHVIDIV